MNLETLYKGLIIEKIEDYLTSQYRVFYHGGNYSFETIEEAKIFIDEVKKDR